LAQVAEKVPLYAPALNPNNDTMRSFLPANNLHPVRVSSGNGNLRTLRRSKNHPTKINAPELDYSSFYGKTGMEDQLLRDGG
jgi:hypothetical protein